MNSDAVLACFLAGASLADLSEALAVPRATLEQLLRESVRPGPRRATTGPPARPSSRPSPPAALAPSNGHTRRSAAQIEALVLQTLASHAPAPRTQTELMIETQTSRSVLMRLLATLVKRGTVTRQGRQFRLTRGRA